jgi:hypothetical protein
VVALRVSQALEKEPEKRQRYVGDVINEYLFDLAVDELLEAAARNRPWAVRKMSAAVQACLPRASEDGEERTVGRIVLKTLAGAAVSAAVLAPVVWVASPFWLPVFRTTASVGSTVTDARDAERGGGSGPVSPSIPTLPADAPVEAVDADSTPAQTPDEVREQKRSATVRARQDGRTSSTGSGTAGRAARMKGAPPRSSRRTDQPPISAAVGPNARPDRSAGEPPAPRREALPSRGEVTDPGAIIDWLLRGR